MNRKGPEKNPFDKQFQRPFVFDRILGL